MKQLINNYYNWLKTNTVIIEKEGYLEIETPFLNNHNNNITIYVENHDCNTLILMDDSNTIEDLECHNYNFDSINDEDKILKILNLYNVDYDHIHKELILKTNKDNFHIALHNFIQCILKLQNLHLFYDYCYDFTEERN